VKIRQKYFYDHRRKADVHTRRADVYKNSFGLDRQDHQQIYNYAAQCRRVNIPVTTFMIAEDPYLQQYVHEFYGESTKAKHFYTRSRRLAIYLKITNEIKKKVTIIKMKGFVGFFIINFIP